MRSPRVSDIQVSSLASLRRLAVHREPTPRSWRKIFTSWRRAPAEARTARPSASSPHIEPRRRAPGTSSSGSCPQELCAAGRGRRASASSTSNRGRNQAPVGRIGVEGTSSGARSTVGLHRCRVPARPRPNTPETRIAAILGLRSVSKAVQASRTMRLGSVGACSAQARLRPEPTQGQPEPDRLPLVADMPPSGSHPIPKQRRGLSRIQHRFRPGERLPPGEQESRGPSAEQPVCCGHEARIAFDHGTGLSMLGRAEHSLSRRARRRAIERRNIRVARVLTREADPAHRGRPRAVPRGARRRGR